MRCASRHSGRTAREMAVFVMQRGRKSLEARRIDALGLEQLGPTQRPPAPSELSKAQKTEWDAIVNRMPADWFGREMHPILANLCRAVVFSRRFAAELDVIQEELESLQARIPHEPTKKEIEALMELSLDRRAKVAKLQTDQARLVASLSTKLRLTPQSRFQSVTAGRKMFDRNQESDKKPLWD
jgi:hypothetical protein